MIDALNTIKEHFSFGVDQSTLKVRKTTKMIKIRTAESMSTKTCKIARVWRRRAMECTLRSAAASYAPRTATRFVASKCRLSTRDVSGDARALNWRKMAFAWWKGQPEVIVPMRTARLRCERQHIPQRVYIAVQEFLIDARRCPPVYNDRCNYCPDTLASICSVSGKCYDHYCRLKCADDTIRK